MDPRDLARRAGRADWPRVLGVPAVTGILRASSEDFEVEELPRVEPAGAGAHLWLWAEKRGANTPWVADQLARVSGCRPRDVGYAGMKDRHALTRQWFSVPFAANRDTGCWREWCIEGVQLLDARRHARKLQRGALAGNRFRIVVRELRGATVELAGRLQGIAEQGLPNYFGEQRFGHGGSNLTRAVDALLRGARPPRDRRGIYLSALRSALFNEVLGERVESGSWNVLLPGEVAMLDRTNSVFVCGEIDAELQRRCRVGDLHPTGPLPGRPSIRPSAEAARIEEAVLAQRAELVAALCGGVAAGRRSLRLKPVGLEWDLSGDRLELRFELPAGGYATSVIRELVNVAG